MQNVGKRTKLKFSGLRGTYHPKNVPKNYDVQINISRFPRSDLTRGFRESSPDHPWAKNPPAPTGKPTQTPGNRIYFRWMVPEQHQKIGLGHPPHQRGDLARLWGGYFAKFREMAEGDKVTSPTRPDRLPHPPMVLDHSYGIAIQQKNYGGGGRSIFLTGIKLFWRWKSAKITKFREIGNGTKVDQPRRQNSLVSVHNCQKSKEEIHTSSAKLTRTKNINYSWRKCILDFWKKSSDFWKFQCFQ